MRLSALFLFVLPSLVRTDFVNLQRLHDRWLRENQLDDETLFIQQQGSEISFLRESFFDQKINHFDATTSATFKQRYFLNMEHYVPGSSVFLYVGGEAELRSSRVQYGAMVDIAKKHKHRYYGVSHPFKNLTSENLRFLSSQQALHDLAYFIQKSSDLLDMPALAKAKWIIVGGSYPANLAAWFRQKFPHLVIGAWASSGPVLAKADYWEYDAVVGKQLGSKCAKMVRKATDYLEDMIEHQQQSVVMTVKNWFHPKMAIQVTDNVSFLYVLADVVAYVVQYDNPGIGLRERLCQTMPDMSTDSDGEQAALHFSNFTRFFFDKQGIEPQEMDMTAYGSTGPASPTENSRQWMWQCCTEFGYWQTAPRLGFSLRSKLINEQWHMEKICTGLYGLPQDHKVPTETINSIYGARNIMNTTTSIVFTNGARDPWKVLSVPGYELDVDADRPDVQVSNQHGVPSYIVPGVGHCADLGVHRPGDPLVLVLARELIATEIAGWLE